MEERRMEIKILYSSDADYLERVKNVKEVFSGDP